MDPGSSSLEVAPDVVIGSATSLEDIVAALAQRSCADLTSSIDLDACGKLPIAKGGFGDVFKAKLRNGTKIAIKTLRVYDRPGEDDERQKILNYNNLLTLYFRPQRTAREIYYWSKLTHPNVLQLEGLAVFDGHVSMISAWMDNGDLRSYVRLNPNANRLELCLGVGEGLCYIHNRGMVHGDLKAANVMVSHSGVPQITDFGNSQLKDATLNFTNTKNFGHTLRWTSPELLDSVNSSQTSKEADVYAYGMTAVEAMTGQIPFEGLSDRQVIGLLIHKKEVPRPNVGIGDDLWDILTRCWTLVPTKRAKIWTVKNQIRNLVVKGYTDVIAANPNEPVHLMKRAALYMAGKRFALALADYQKVASLQSPPPAPGTLLQIACCHLARGCNFACTATLRDLPESTPGVSNVRRRAEQLGLHLQQFKDARDKDEWSVARSVLGRAIEMLEGNVPVQWGCWQIECEIANGSWVDARKVVSGALRRTPNSPDLLSLRGLTMFLTKQIPKAIRDAEEALRLNPSHKSARRLLQRAREVEQIQKAGNKSFKTGRLDKAVEEYGKALGVIGQSVGEAGGGPLRAALLGKRAIARLKLKEFLPALEDTNASLALNANSYEVLRTRVHIRVELRDFERALQDLRVAFELVGDDGVASGKLLRLAHDIEKLKITIQGYHGDIGAAAAELPRSNLVQNPSRHAEAIDQGGDEATIVRVVEINPRQYHLYIYDGYRWANQDGQSNSRTDPINAPLSSWIAAVCTLQPPEAEQSPEVSRAESSRFASGFLASGGIVGMV